MKESTYCALCGTTLSKEQLHWFNGQLYCEHCLEERTAICYECEERIWLEDDCGDNSRYLCQNCYDAHYTNCHRCGQLVRQSNTYCLGNDDADAYCESCYELLVSRQTIHNYNYKPDPILSGEGPRFFGVELEMDDGGEDSTNARFLLKIANQNETFLYIKHDGSLDDGLELVTHPLSLHTHLHKMPWQKVLREAVSMGYLSHRTRTCGLHIHVSRAAFGSTETQQDTVIARILYFVEKHWEELLKFSRRTQSQLQRWAARYGYKESPKDILVYTKKDWHSSRYSCVNLQNYDNLEFRMFRGTLKYNTLIATLQMVNRICDVALFMFDGELKEMSWTTFVSGVQEPQLVQYLKERRLYINEPVETEEEL